jgi:hypothetical protein
MRHFISGLTKILLYHPRNGISLIFLVASTGSMDELLPNSESGILNGWNYLSRWKLILSYKTYQRIAGIWLHFEKAKSRSGCTKVWQMEAQFIATLSLKSAAIWPYGSLSIRWCDLVTFGRVELWVNYCIRRKIWARVIYDQYESWILKRIQFHSLIWLIREDYLILIFCIPRASLCSRPCCRIHCEACCWLAARIRGIWSRGLILQFKIYKIVWPEPSETSIL